MPNLLHVVQKVDEINEMVLAKGELAVVYRTAQTDRLRSCLKTGNTEQIHSSNIDILVSGVRRKITSYNLPFGKIIVHYGVRSEPSPGQGGLGSEHFAMRGTWEFQPASWISYRSIITEAQLLVRCGAELAHPTITSSLTTRSALSWEHPIWKYVQHGDVMGVQRLLRTGAVRATDMGTDGSTLLHSVGQSTTSIPFLFRPNHKS